MDNQQLATRIAGDLFRIHGDRIDFYKQLLRESKNLELDMKAILERIIEESIKYRQELEEKAGNMDGVIAGKIYNLWLSSKKPFSETDKKTILATCADDELATMNTYSMALSVLQEGDIKTLLETQQQSLRKLHSHIRRYHSAQ